MKKKIFMAAVVMCSLALLSACGKKNTQSAEEKKEEIDILKEMESANDTENLVKKNGRVACNSTIILGDGTLDEIYMYADEDKRVREDAAGIYYDEDGDVYGKVGEDNEIFFRYVFVGEEAYKQYCQGYEIASLYQYNEAEKVESCEEKDGILEVVTSEENQELIDRMTTEYAYDSADEYTKIKTVYELDADSYEILEANAYIVTKDGKEQPCFKIVREENPEEITVDESIKEKLNQGEQRKATIIVDNGTEKEKTYTQTVSKGSSFQIVIDSSMDQHFYEDPEYKKVCQGTRDTIDMTKDCVLYVRSIEQ